MRQYNSLTRGDANFQSNIVLFLMRSVAFDNKGIVVNSYMTVCCYKFSLFFFGQSFALVSRIYVLFQQVITFLLN